MAARAIVTGLERQFPHGRWVQDEFVIPEGKKVTECDEVAANMPLTGLDSFRECRERVRDEMPDETATVVDNVAEALFLRLRRAQGRIK